jgi:Uma2 family endonuclease
MDRVDILDEPRTITGDQLLAMGDIGPCELVEGRVVPMTPPGGEHGEIELTIGAEVRAFVRRHRLGLVMVGEVGVYTHRDPDTVRAADVVFVAQPGGYRPPAGYLDVAPDLVVEILSPSDRRGAVRRKVAEHLAAGVFRVWLVDPRTRTVQVFRSPADAVRLAMGDVLRGEGALDGFALPVGEVFGSGGQSSQTVW